jgi:hypothetical protein
MYTSSNFITSSKFKLLKLSNQRVKIKVDIIILSIPNIPA